MLLSLSEYSSSDAENGAEVRVSCLYDNDCIISLCNSICCSLFQSTEVVMLRMVLMSGCLVYVIMTASFHYVYSICCSLFQSTEVVMLRMVLKSGCPVYMIMTASFHYVTVSVVLSFRVQ